MVLTVEEVKMLAKCERDMTSGEQSFVVGKEGRWAFSREVLEECGVVSGQVVSQKIINILMRMSLAKLRVQIALQKAKDGFD